MPVVNVHIGKRDFQLMCGDGQEAHLKKLADQVSERVSALSQQMGHSNDTLLLVMASLMMQDELNEGAKKKSSPGDGDASASSANDNEAVIEALNAVSQYVETVAQRIENS